MWGPGSALRSGTFRPFDGPLPLTQVPLAGGHSWLKAKNGLWSHHSAQSWTPPAQTLLSSAHRYTIQPSGQLRAGFSPAPSSSLFSSEILVKGSRPWPVLPAFGPPVPRPTLQAQASMKPLWLPSPQSPPPPSSHQFQPLSSKLQLPSAQSLVFRGARREQVGVTAPPRDPCRHTPPAGLLLLTHHCRASGQVQNSTASGDKAF